MKLVYVAGPYRGENAWVIEQNVRAAEQAALRVYDVGAQPVAPHVLGRFYQGRIPDEVALAGTLALMRKCDAVLLLPTWRASSGATEERRVAIEAGMPVFDLAEYEAAVWGDLKAWVVTSCRCGPFDICDACNVACVTCATTPCPATGGDHTLPPSF